MADIKYKRIVFKLSGESLAGEQRFGINPEVVESIAKQIKKVREYGIEVAIVVGGGNMVLLVAIKVWIELQQIIWVCLLQ